MSADKTIEFDSETKKNLSNWLEGDYDQKTKDEINRLIKENPQEIIDSFYRHLEFGTAGLRGIMGVGTNRMNRYTVASATQGLANYLKKAADKPHTVFIGYDSRHHSREFAEEAAKVLAGNGIEVYLPKDIRPTPLVSFGVRHLNCSAGIMITASHNLPQYNGYKVYWNDGGQVLPPHDVGIIDEANKITDLSQIQWGDLNSELITEAEVDEAYLRAISSLQLHPEQNKKSGSDLKIVYTSLHGTGITLIGEAMKGWGFPEPILVEKQVIPDGDFPTAPSPNPEERHALDLGIQLMESQNADLVIANDPDADRVGIAVNHQGESLLLNGNQVAAILMEHVLESGKVPDNAAFIKTVVTTELMQAIADSYQKPLVNVLPGFKYIAKQIREWEAAKSLQFVFGGEESYGYLLGTNTRDKDAIIISCLIAEAALNAKLQGKTLIEKLHDLYEKHGVFIERLKPIKFEDSKAGKEAMKKGMESLRNNPLKEINGIPVAIFEDYLTGLKGFSKANILTFWLEDGSKIMIRPSGTEPKVKIYCGTQEKKSTSIDLAIKDAENKCVTLLDAVSRAF